MSTKVKVARQKSAKAQDVDDEKALMEGKVPFWSLLDFDDKTNFTLLVIFRLIQACTLTWNV